MNGFLAWVSTLLRNSCGDTESQESAARILDAAALRSLSIVSLNVWGLPSLMGYGAKHPERFSKLRGALRNAPYDIVALQEMWDPRTDVIRHESGYPFSASDVSASTLWRASGLLTLSRHPITVSEFLPFSRQSGVERAVRKGALFTRVETAPGHLVDVYNVHLASEPEKINTMLVSTREVKAIRTAQLDQLSEWITRRRLGATPVLVVGDLNVHEYDPEYISLANRLGTDTFRTRHPADTASDGGYTFDPERNPFALSPTMRPERIDYVFSLFSEDAEVTSSERIFVEDPLSDHYGLHTTFYY